MAKPGTDVKSKPKKSKNHKQQGAGGKAEKKTPQKTFLKKLDEPFEQYMSRDDVLCGLNEKKLIQGALRINANSYEDAYVDDPVGGPDYYVKGTMNRNRAFNDDLVVINVLPPEQWELITSIADGDTGEKIDAATTAEPSSKAFHKEENKVDNISAAMQETLVLDSAPLNDNRGDLVEPAAISSEELQAKSDYIVKVDLPPGTGNNSSIMTESATVMQEESLTTSDDDVRDEVCRYYDSRQYHRVLTETYRGVHGDSADGRDITSIPSVITPNLDQVINGYQLRMYKRTAKVVYIMQKKHCRICSGHLKHFDKTAGVVLVSPIDCRVPRVVVPLAECPEDFPKNPKKYQSTLFIIKITDWPVDSPFASGHLTRNLGETTEVDAHTERFLVDHDVEHCEFSDEVLQCLPSDLPWRIPDEEIRKRRDFRRDCIFSIDPSTARDLDDALHCKTMDDGNLEVGVHIADVSYFVKEYTALDETARSRATSVYLTQKVIPMLPRLLCEQLCSLNPDEDRLSFSAVWKMTKNGKILDEWMGRSLIRSCAKLSYDHAQLVIDNPEGHPWGGAMPTITNGYTVKDVATCITMLNKIARSLRRQRFVSGALSLNQGKIVFSLDHNTGLPNGVDVYVQRESNKLIEEFMLLANMAVAHRLQGAFPRLALLRRHPSPKLNKAEDLRNILHYHGIEVNISSARVIQSCINAHIAHCGSDTQGLAMTALFAKVMENARYFCLGTLTDPSESCHYALSVPLYTHFTSPIRRYADVIVHRMLAQALGIADSVVKIDEEEVKSIADNCNTKKLNSKRVETLSREFFFAIFLRECGALTEDGIVIQILDKSFDVLAGRLGLVRRVYCDKLSLVSYEHRLESKKPILTLRWKDKDDVLITKDMMLFTDVRVILSTEKDSTNIDATVILLPDTAEKINFL